MGPRRNGTGLESRVKKIGYGIRHMLYCRFEASFLFRIQLCADQTAGMTIRK
jgi:hypothetical protein